MASLSEPQLSDIQSPCIGLVQIILMPISLHPMDKESNSLALLMTQVCPNTEGTHESTKIKQLKKENRNVLYKMSKMEMDCTKSDIPVSYNHGPKKSEMPEVAKKCVLPLNC